MTRRYRYQIFFGVVAAIGSFAIFLFLDNATNWPWYFSWLMAASAVAFIFYAVDKGLAKANAIRVPEVVLHILALAGGAVGALLGMLALRHKRNFRAHPLFLPIILIGIGIWGVLIYRLMQL